jgi:hypothetical protein
MHKSKGQSVITLRNENTIHLGRRKYAGVVDAVEWLQSAANSRKTTAFLTPNTHSVLAGPTKSMASRNTRLSD